jgi:hypothetical protein
MNALVFPVRAFMRPKVFHANLFAGGEQADELNP